MNDNDFECDDDVVTNEVVDENNAEQRVKLTFKVINDKMIVIYRSYHNIIRYKHVTTDVKIFQNQGDKKEEKLLKVLDKKKMIYLL